MGDKTMRVAVIWQDGTRDECETGWVDLETSVRRRQWHAFTPDEWRGEMRERVVVLTGSDTPELEVATSERFFEILETLGLIRREVKK